MPEEALRLNSQIDDHSELIKELAQRYLYLLKKKSETEFEPTTTNESNKETLQDMGFKKIVLTAPEITIEKVIEKVIKAYDCSDLNQREALQKSIESDLQNLDPNPDDEEEEDENSQQQQQQTEKSTNDKVEDKEKNTETLDELEKVYFSSATKGDQNLPTLEEVMVGMMQNTIPGEKRKIPHITELSVLLSKGMFPKGVFNDDDEKLDRLSKHFVMMFPTAKLQVLEDVKTNEFYRFFKEFESDCKAILKRVENDHIFDDACATEDTLQNEFMLFIYNNHEMFKMAKRIIDFVIAKQEFGATGTEIKNEFGCGAYLNKIVGFLLHKRVLLRVGVASVIFIHFQYRHNWFLKHQALSDDDIHKLKAREVGKLEEFVSAESSETHPKLIKPTPWVTINGKINETALRKWFGTILSYCLKNPKVQFTALTKKFYYLKPLDLFSILEYLQELGCVKMMVLKYETNLFSMNVVINSGEVSILDNIDDIYVNVTPTAILRLGYFLSVLRTEYPL